MVKSDGNRCTANPKKTSNSLWGKLGHKFQERNILLYLS